MNQRRQRLLSATDGNKIDEVVDPRGFEKFVELPAEIKLAIFDCIPFVHWVLTLSPVCKEWRKLCLQSKKPKIFTCTTCAKYGTITSTALYEIVKNYQVYGLDLRGLSPYCTEVVPFSKILTASDQLTWVTLVAKEFTSKKYNSTLGQKTCLAARSVSVKNYALFSSWVSLFPNLKELRIDALITNRIDALHPTLKILRCMVRGKEMAAELLPVIKNLAPNIETIYMTINLGDLTPKTLVSTVYEELEKQAEGLNIKLYCRDLFRLVSDVDLFIQSFHHQGLPYSYYQSAAPQNFTLLSEAVRKAALPTVMFLLDNEITTLEKELAPDQEPEVFHRAVKSAEKGDFPFLVNVGLDMATPDLTGVIDYLLSKGFDITKKVAGRSFFESKDLQSPVVSYIAARSNIDFFAHTSNGRTVMHEIFRSSAIELFRMAKQQVNAADMTRLLATQDNDGNTPLHDLYLCSEEFYDEISQYNLGWEIKNKEEQTPLYKLVSALRFDRVSVPFRRMAALVSSIQPGIPTLLFTKHRSANILVPDIAAMAAKGADLNEIIEGDPAVMKLVCFSPALIEELLKHGVNIHAVDKDHQTLLYNLIQNWNVDIIDLLESFVKKYGFDVNHVSKKGLTPLTYAMSQQKPIEIIDLLLELGADPNGNANSHAPHDNALYMATTCASSNVMTVVESVLKAGADPNRKVYSEAQGKVFLPLVRLLNFKNESSTLLELLLEYGMDMHMKDDIGNTLSHLVKYSAYVQHLFNHLDVNATNDLGQTPLWGQYLTSDAVACMIKKNANVNHVALDGSTPLHFAAFSAKYDCLRELLAAKKIDISVLNKRGQSFLHTAEVGRREYIIKYVERIFTLFDQSTDERKTKIKAAFNHVDIFGRTVVHYLSETTNLEFMQRFIEKFELDLNPKSGVPILQSSWTLTKIEYFLSKGTDPNAQSCNGNTLLHSVCDGTEALDIARLLLKYGASIEIKNLDGIAPVDINPTLKTGLSAAVYSVLDIPRNRSISRGIQRRVRRDSDLDTDI